MERPDPELHPDAVAGVDVLPADLHDVGLRRCAQEQHRGGHVVEGSGFSSPTDFIVYVLRDLMGEAGAAEKAEFSKGEIEDLKRRLKKLGYL